MNWFTSLFSTAAEKPIKAIGDVFDELFTSDDERAASEIVMEKLRQHPGELQVGINKIEAGHRSIFVAGWRPFIGWVCGVSLGIFYIPQFAVATYLWVTIVLETGKLAPYPVSADGIMELVLALLGMATIRMGEKMSGKAK